MNADLQAALAAARAKVEFHYPWWLRLFLQRNVIGIVLGRSIYIAPAMRERPAEELEQLIRHELEHVRQVARLGLVRFLWRYLAEYAALRREGKSAAAAYNDLSFEREAREAEKA
ncbi:MAG TPA: hypothetical protein VGR02_21430 [Thermoanaerobaculia bacterium]|nr:hypothetical protein [Thermoanaerobaculia bacterium]